MFALFYSIQCKMIWMLAFYLLWPCRLFGQYRMQKKTSNPMNFAISRASMLFFLLSSAFCSHYLCDAIMDINLNKLDATIRPTSNISPICFSCLQITHAIGAILLNTFDKFVSIFDNIVSLFCRVARLQRHQQQCSHTHQRNRRTEQKKQVKFHKNE